MGVPSGNRKAFAVGIRGKPGGDGERLRELKTGPQKEPLAAHFPGGIPEQEGNVFPQAGDGREGALFF